MVMVSKWVEAFPAKHANSLAVTRALLTEIVPWWEAGGAVERENGTLKAKLAKSCEGTGLNWIDALVIVLMYMRMRII